MMITSSPSQQDLMKISSSMLVFLLCFLSLLLHPCHSTTVLVDGVSDWKNPNVHIGDTIIFNHKNHYKLYIFRNNNAFNFCNFTQATLLTKPNSTSYTWHPSRLGLFYFAFNNGSMKSCQGSQKLSIEVSPAIPSPELAPAPAHASGGGVVSSSPAPVYGGGVVASSPAYPWPSHPHEGGPPGPAPSSGSSASFPVTMPGKGGAAGGMPFINSNPAVPLPSGEIDSATILPLPTSDHEKLVGLISGPFALFSVVFLIL